MTQREIIEALRSSLGTIGAGGLSGMTAIEAYATCHQLLGRLEANLEIEERRAKGQAGFPRPEVETIDPDTVDLDSLDRVERELLAAFMIPDHRVRGMASRY